MAITDIGEEANALFDQLAEGVNITIPDIDLSGPEYDFPFDDKSELYQAVTRPSICDITTGDVKGEGAFDKIMQSVAEHLKGEYDSSRITGAEYTKAYIALVESSMGNATQFVLSRDMSFWQAQQAQLAAITARIQMQTAKVQMAQLLYSALREKAAYVLAKMQALGAAADYKTSEYNLENILPLQKDMLVKQNSGQTLQNEGYDIDNRTKNYTLVNTLPKQLEMLVVQITGQETQNEGLITENQTKVYTLNTIMPLQRNLLSGQVDAQAMQTEGYDLDNQIKNFNVATMLPKQFTLLSEQVEAARAQTLDTRTDGVPVVGSLGKQKELYSQQITSYQRRSEMDAAKFWVDAWTVQKTIDEGLTPPTNFTNTNVDQVLSKIRTNNNLTT